MVYRLNQHDTPVAALSDEQFAELKQLLAPGHELAALMLADYKARRDTPPVDHSDNKAGPEAEPQSAPIDS